MTTPDPAEAARPRVVMRDETDILGDDRPQTVYILPGGQELESALKYGDIVTLELTTEQEALARDALGELLDAAADVNAEIRAALAKGKAAGERYAERTADLAARFERAERERDEQEAEAADRSAEHRRAELEARLALDDETRGPRSYARAKVPPPRYSPTSHSTTTARNPAPVYRLHLAGCRVLPPTVSPDPDDTSAPDRLLRADDAMAMFLDGAPACGICHPVAVLRTASRLTSLEQQRVLAEQARRDDAVPLISHKALARIFRAAGLDWSDASSTPGYLCATRGALPMPDLREDEQVVGRWHPRAGFDEIPGERRERVARALADAELHIRWSDPGLGQPEGLLLVRHRTAAEKAAAPEAAS